MVQTIFDFDEKNELFEKMIPTMVEKFLKYFEEIPHVFMCALALNPCLNATRVHTIIDETNMALRLYISKPNWATHMKATFDNDFQILYDTYLEKYGPGLQMGSMGGEGSRASSSRGNLKINLFNIVKDQTAKRQRGEAPNSELGRYKGSNFTGTFTATEFENLISWLVGKESNPNFLSFSL